MSDVAQLKEIHTVLLLSNQLFIEACDTIINGVSYKISLLISICLTYLLLTWYQIKAIIALFYQIRTHVLARLTPWARPIKNIVISPLLARHLISPWDVLLCYCAEIRWLLQRKFISAPLLYIIFPLSSSCFSEIS